MRAKPFLIGNCKSPFGCWWSRNPPNLTTLNFPFIAISLNNPTLWAPRLPLFLLSLALLLFLQIFTYFHFVGLLSLFSVGRWREEPISISGAYHIFLWPRVQDKGHYPSGLSLLQLDCYEKSRARICRHGFHLFRSVCIWVFGFADNVAHLIYFPQSHVW